MNGPAKKSELLPKKEGPKWLSQLRKAYKSNTFLIIISVCCAVLLWSVLVASDGTLTRERVFTNVSVNPVGLETLKSNGYIVVDDLAQVLPNVRLTVEVTQDNYSRVSKANFAPRLDVSQIRATGEQTVPITFTTTVYGKVLECEPSSVTINVERYVSSNRIPVVLQTTGELAEGLWAKTPQLDPTYISVSGPQSMISSIKRVVAKFDQSMLNGDMVDQRNAIPFVLQDAQGNEIDASLLRTTYQSILIDTVTVDSQVYPEKAVPIAVNGAYIGEPAEGYEVTGVTITPESVLVAAPSDVLEQFATVMLDAPVDISGAQETRRVSVRMKKLADAQHMSVNEAQIEVTIAEKQWERTFKNVPITLVGLQENQEATLSSESVHVTLTGPYHFMQALTAEDIVVTAQVSDATEGEQLVGLACSVANAPELTSTLSIDQVAVQIAPSAQE